jgi:hypothetical protein
MGPKKCEYNKLVMGGFLAISIYSFCCGSWLLGTALIFLIAIHVVDVRRKNRYYQSWLDKQAENATRLYNRRKQ